MLKLAIVILNWNGKKFLEKFLPSVITNSPSYAKVYVADNGSVDGSGELVTQQFPQVQFLDLGKNLGYTGGYNLALEHIDAQYYVLLNSDIQVEPGWVEPVIDLMDQHPDIAACQPKILSWHNQDEFEYAGASGGFIDKYGFPFCRGRIFEYLEKDTGQYNELLDVFWATGACMFLRRIDFEKAGRLDADFFAHMEEIDLCWRLKRMGKRIVCQPSSVVYHVGGGTLPKNSPMKTFLNFRNNILLLSKNLPANTFYIILLKRIVLDFVASVKFLFSGHIKDCFAVLRAHIYVLMLMRKKRNEGKELPYIPVEGVYRRSIVREYFIAGRKKYSQLDQARFGRM